MFHFLSPKAEPKAEPKAPETVRIPRKKFDAIMGGAMDAMGDLTEFAKQAKARRDDSPIGISRDHATAWRSFIGLNGDSRYLYLLHSSAVTF